MVEVEMEEEEEKKWREVVGFDSQHVWKIGRAHV